MKSAVALLLLAGAAHAGTVHRPEAIDLDTDMTPPGRAEFGFDGGGPVGAYALSLQLGFLDKPMRVHNVDPDVSRRPSRDRWLGGALSLGPSVVVDARMPLSHQTGDRWQTWATTARSIAGSPAISTPGCACASSTATGSPRSFAGS